MKSLSDWLAYLESLHPKGQGGIELGLERVARVKIELRQSQHCPLIVVGGTNGKGSTCAYLEAIYTHAGYRVGCYTSPHLLDYNERVRVGRTAIDDTRLCQAFARVEAARQSAGAVALTYFEFGTLAAWEVFAAAEVELVILEVGLGGRLDAVNVYDADCAIVTGIALDHTDWLGNTREAIGFEKAGIYRAGKPALCADLEPPQSLVDHATALGAELRLIGRDFAAVGADAGLSTWTFRSDGQVRLEGLPRPSLRGIGQLGNAAVVLDAVHRLQALRPVSEDAIRRGLVDVVLPGRFQRLPGRPAVVLDVAHNPQAVAGLAASLESMAGFEGGVARTFAVVGMLADKDIPGALAAFAGKVDVWLLAGLDVPRGAPVGMLAAAVRDGELGGAVECFDTPAAAWSQAAKLAGEDDRIVVFGSFYTVAAVMRVLKPNTQATA